MQTGATGLHGAHMGASRDLRRVAHDLYFCRRFIQAHVMQQMIQSNEFVWRLSAEARLGADRVDPFHQVAIKIGVAAHRRVHPVTAFNQPWQDVVDVSDGERVVSAEVADSAFLPGTQAIPQLTLGIALAAKQYVFAVGPARDQDNDRLRLGKAAQVLEIALLTINMLNIAIANCHCRSRKNRNAVGLHLRHERLAATCVFRFRDMDHGQTGSLLKINQCSEGFAAAGSSAFLVSANRSNGATRRYSITCM